MNKITFLESEVKMPLMKLPVRSVVVRINENNILISPGSKLSKEQIQSVGTITDIVAPNLFHCGGVSKAAELNPNSKLWAPLEAKELKPEIAWSHILDKLQWPYQQELTMIPLSGMPKISEVVFFHKESKSLIVADLCFNMKNQKSIGAKIILGLFGTYQKFAISKFFLKYVVDKNEFEKSLENLFKYDFDNIIVSHGDNVFGHGKALLLNALAERGFFPKNQEKYL